MFVFWLMSLPFGSRSVKAASRVVATSSVIRSIALPRSHSPSASQLVAFGLQIDVIFFAAIRDRVHAPGAHGGFQRAANRLNRDTERGRAFAVDVHHDARAGRLVVHARAHEIGILAQAIDHAARRNGQRLVFGAQQHDGGIARSTTAPALECAWHTDADRSARDLA